MNCWKVRIQNQCKKNSLHSYVFNEISRNEIKKNKLLFHATATKRIKYLGMNLIKYVKNLYTEN